MVSFQKAVPVWGEKVQVNQYLDFRQFFDCQDCRELKLIIRCHSNYAVWVNGHLAGFGQYPDYEEYRVVDCLEISSALLWKGKNILAVLAYCQYEDSSTYRKGTPSLIFELRDQNDVIAYSGHQTLYREDRCYHSGPREKITPQLGFTFSYDSRLADSWQKDTNAAGFCPASLLPAGGVYHKRPIQKLRLLDACPAVLIGAGEFFCTDEKTTAAERIYSAYIRPHSIVSSALGQEKMVLTTEKADGVYALVDLGEERAGCLMFCFHVEKDCLVDIGYGEHLDDLRVRSFVGGRHFGCSYYAKAGENRFTHYLTRLAGRYLQLHFYIRKAAVEYIGLRETPYPAAHAKMPAGLDSMEQKIYETGLRTLRLCMHEHYEDCPWREQALYAMDSRNQMLAGYAAFEEYSFAKASIRLLGLGIRPDGLLELCAPARVGVTIPAFSLMWIVSLWEYVQNSEDMAFGKEWLPTARRLLDTFCNRMEEDLVSIFEGQSYWNFYEWSPGLDGTFEKQEKTDCLLNLFFAYALQAYDHLANTLQEEEEQNFAKKTYKLLADRINSVFWDQEQGGYRISPHIEQTPELAQALAVISGVGSVHKKTLVNGLLQKNYFPYTTLSSKIFTFDALLQQPENAEAVRDEIRAVWGRMLLQGAATFWETEKGAADFENAGSLCHGWSAVPAYIYHRLKHEMAE